ncbi:pentapeptide repeat-containing protein [Glycomyces scopariae]
MVIVGILSALWILPKVEDAELEAFRAIATTVIGAGGLVTLLVITRRQMYQEYDSKERRITEQYMQAVEQLGHEKAPVRLAAMHALDRLGRDYPTQQQVISEVWCAYLRSHYRVPKGVAIHLDSHPSYSIPSGDEPPAPEEEREALAEFEVRLTAQRLLAGHLKYKSLSRSGNPVPADNFWNIGSMDLTGAILFNFDLSNCTLPTFQADRAIFFGRTRFREANFQEKASFRGAVFRGILDHDGIRSINFRKDVSFTDAEFCGHSRLSEVHFHGTAGFRDSAFNNGLLATKLDFHEAATFQNAHFHGKNSEFQNAHFYKDGVFSNIETSASLKFHSARFCGPLSFREPTAGAQFLDLSGIKLRSEPNALPSGWESVEIEENWWKVEKIREEEI